MNRLYTFTTRHPVATLLIAATLLLLPLVFLGFPWSGDDAGFHLSWTRAFSEQLWSGDFYPRWLHGTDRGLGGPVFYLYPPMEGYLASLFQPLASVDPEGRFRLSLTMLLVTLLTTLFTYRWLADMTESRSAPFFGTLIYIIAPYHLAIDLYLRTAVAEYIAFMWIPLILHGVRQVVNNREDEGLLNRSILIGTTGLLLTHLLTAMMLLPVVLLYLLIFSSRSGEERFRALLRAGFSGLLGVGIAAIYLLPMVAASDTTVLSQMWEEWTPYHAHFLPDLRILHTSPGKSNLRSMVIMTALFFWLLATALAFFRVWRERRGAGNLSSEGAFWFWTLIGSLFLCTHLSYPVWALLEPLQRLQFPWRFMVIFTVALAPLSLHFFSSEPDRKKTTVSSLLIGRYSILTIALFTTLFLVVRYFYIEPRHLAVHPNVDQPVNPPEYLPSCADLSIGIDSLKSYIRRADSSLLQRISPEGYMVRARLEDGVIHLACEEEDTVRVDLWRHYSPLWRGSSGAGEELRLECVPPHGLLRAVIPPGSGEVRIELNRSEGELLGGSVSLASLLLATLLLLPRRPEKTT